MLNRALTISIIAIFLLLVIQGVWLYRLIDNEKIKYLTQTEEILKDAIDKELNSRLIKISNLDNFSVTISNKMPSDIQIDDKNVENIDLQDGKKFTKVSIEEALQDAYKNILPLNIDTLSTFFSKKLIEEGKITNYILTYSDPQKSYKTK
jgi:low affinity Fe/Cu permease